MRPAMYVGGTDSEALHRLVLELLDNAVDEAIAGFAREIRVELDQACSVQDDGRGIPQEALAEGVVPVVLLTTLHSGAKFGGGAYQLTGGLHGVGLSCVNALSERLELQTWRDGQRMTVACERGQPSPPSVDPHPGHGTRVSFSPDRTVMDVDVRWQPERVVSRARELAFLLPGVTLTVAEPGGEHRFHSRDGLGALAQELTRTRVPLHPEPIVLGGEQAGLRVDAGLQWTSLYADDTRAWVNTVLTPNGGTHVNGAHRAVFEVIRRLHARIGGSPLRLTARDTREGLTCALSVWLAEPQFDGQTKERLVNAHASEAVQQVVEGLLQAWFDAHPTVAQVVVDKAREAARARQAALRARDRDGHGQELTIRHHSDQRVIDDDTYRTQFGIRSANWHASAEWIANAELLAEHGRMARVAPDAQLLDVCCGSGVVGAAFKPYVGHTTGLDITPEMTVLARQRLDEVVLGTVFDIPFPQDRFDIVVNREVMHLFPHPEKMLAEVRRVLKPGGQFVFGQIVPFGPEDAPWMHRIFAKKQPLLHHMFLHEDLLALLDRAGFQVVETAEHTLWEWIDVWIDTWETSALHRHEIRELYYNAPAEVRAIHPIEITSEGRIRDLWRWVIYSCTVP